MVEADVVESQAVRTETTDVDHDPNWAQFFDSVEMESYISIGLCQCIETTEGIGIHPYWLRDSEMGAMEELRKDLGKYSSKFNGYLLGFKRPKQVLAPGRQNRYPQPFIYYQFKISRYIYKPAIGQILTGRISQIGKNAGSCVVFGRFTATVYPSSDDEFNEWKIDDQVTFTVESFDKLRKGAILRGTSTRGDTRQRKRKTPRDRGECANIIIEPIQDTPPANKKRKIWDIE